MTDPKHPVDRAIDLLVFAPLGFALDAKSLMPQLVDRGRDQLNSQVTMARMMGQYAVQHGQNEAGKHLAKVQHQAAEVLAEFGLLGHANHSNGSAAPTAPEPTTEPAAAAEPGSAPQPAPVPRASAELAADLAIPDYDTIPASHVVPRLAGLTPDELEAVRRYESTHRSRQTILNKIARLQG